MVSGIPMVGFAAYSGTGKTTLIEKLVRSLKEDGLRVAVIKHDAHDFEIDREGKDSWRFTRAGADLSIISSETKTALVEQRQRPFSQVVSMVRDVDLILVEGYKSEGMTQIGLRRAAAGKDLPADISRYAAVVTDEAIPDADVPQFGFDDIQPLKAFLIENMGGFTCSDLWTGNGSVL